ncbi:MAG TPA: caspase family protein [Kofleriaceae bacterium]|nr:caspase family protein [Kofleriaceae bacterium]
MTPLDAHALVIGASQYQHIQPLPRVADAEDVAAVLGDPAACGYDLANVALVEEAQATRARILDELDRLARRAGPAATVVIYFSGHGGRAPGGGDSYLMPIDGAWDSEALLDATAISSRQLGAKLGAIAAGRLLVLLDCCHAAGLADARATAPGWVDGLAADALGRLAAGRGRVVMAAARGDGQAYVLARARHGLFTEHLIAGLRGAAGRDDGVVRVLDLYDHVQRNVVARKPAQRPVLKTELEDNFVVALAGGQRGMHAPPPVDPAYDVLVVHAPDDRDRAWAVSTLVRLLEERGVRVCIEEREAEPGHTRVTELERLVSSSRVTVPVLTPRFSKGRFEEIQTIMAQQLGIEDGHARLVPVVRESCEARLGLRMLVALDMTRDENVPRGVDRLVRALRR